ncbi:uncharacterized protein [Hemitrygon akajei]|uniref:uncharacterized protein isoform X3 n=1 Tax=Hemitrygon akajei TaxID=2704970 RepID=UPI003BF99FFD
MLAQSVRIAVLLGIIYCLLSRATCQQVKNPSDTTVVITPVTTVESTPITVGSTPITGDGIGVTTVGTTAITGDGTGVTTVGTTAITGDGTGVTTVGTTAITGDGTGVTTVGSTPITGDGTGVTTVGSTPVTGDGTRVTTVGTTAITGDGTGVTTVGSTPVTGDGTGVTTVGTTAITGDGTGVTTVGSTPVTGDGTGVTTVGTTAITGDGTGVTTVGSTPVTGDGTGVTTVGTTAITGDGTGVTTVGSTPITENATAVMTSNTTVTTTAVITSTPELNCSMIECGANAICKNTFGSYICECAFDYYRENDTCVAGKTFGGEVTVQKVFTEEMKDETSKERKELHDFITEVFKKNLESFGYKSTIIYNVRKGSVIADVTNTFEEGSKVTESIIAEKVQENFTYITIQGCNSDKCDKGTTADCYQPVHGLAECICKTGFYKNSLTETKCTESCALKCKGVNQHCVQQNGIPVCECRPGYKDNSGTCESCPFGYNGINCEDGYQIAILVTGVVCGVVILILGIVLIYLCVRLRRVEPDEQEQPILGSMSSESHGNSQFPRRIPRIDLGNLTNGSSNYYQSDSNKFDYYSRQAPWNELSEFHQRDSYPNRKYDYRR